MNIPDLPNNSNSYKQQQREKEKEALEPRKVEKVIKGTAKVKPNRVRKFADIFLAEDRKSVKEYIVHDVLIPTVKKTIDTIISEGTHIFLWGSKGSGSRTSSGSKISYSSFYDKGGRDFGRGYADTSRTHRITDDITVPTRGDAEEVLITLNEMLDRYPTVRVADLYDAVGLTCDWTGNDYGWTDISTARIERTRDGEYAIIMPRAMPIKK